jgi:hypothetical protein
MGIETALIGAGISAAGSIASGAMGASAAGKAADAQANAAAQSTALQRDIFNKQTELQAPFRAGGLTAQNRLLTLLGLNPMDAATYGVANPNYNATDAAAGVNTKDKYILPQGLNVDPNSPDYGKYARDFSMADYQADPGYAFRLKEGLKALDAQAAARGGMISGAALKAAGRYGQDYASNEYANAFNRYQTNRSNQLQPLQSLMGVGQTATNATSNAAGTYGAAAGSNALAAGNALASGAVGQANAWNSAFGGVGKAFNSSTYGGGGGYQGGGIADMFTPANYGSGLNSNGSYNVGNVSYLNNSPTWSYGG